MAGLTNAESQATLDARFPTAGATDEIAYSEDGATETAIMARTAIGSAGWAAATTADPSVKANANALTSADATGAGTLTHYAIFSSGGVQRTDWDVLRDGAGVATPRTLAIGDSLTWDIGDCEITLT